MRPPLYMLTIILMASCGQGNGYDSTEKNATAILDTLRTENYLLILESADSFETTDIYGDLSYRINLTDTIGNWHGRAEKIQSYLAEKFGEYFYLTPSTLVLKLNDEKTLSFPIWDEEKDEGYNFEHYFDNIDYYLLRVQWSEGNRWMLVNRKNGFKKYINGLPYISSDNKKIVSSNSDLEAGYSFNGIELYSILADSLRTEFRMETEWWPADVKWINENQFLLKREHLHLDNRTGARNDIVDFKRVTIVKKAS